MKLYYSPGACSMASHIAIEETKTNCSLEKVDLKEKTYSGGDYKAVNPKGSVPAIQLDNGQVLTEGAVILQYIADQKPEAMIIPKPGTFERYRCQEWLNFIATDVHKGFSPLFNSAMSAEARETQTAALSKKFDRLNDALSKKNFLMGDQFTVADAYLFTVASWAPRVKFDLSRWPAVNAFQDRMMKRPSVVSAMKSEGLL